MKEATDVLRFQDRQSIRFGIRTRESLARVYQCVVEDKYIGLALAMLGSLAIGTSFIITKKVRTTQILEKI